MDDPRRLFGPAQVNQRKQNRSSTTQAHHTPSGTGASGKLTQGIQGETEELAFLTAETDWPSKVLPSQGKMNNASVRTENLCLGLTLECPQELDHDARLGPIETEVAHILW